MFGLFDDASVLFIIVDRIIRWTTCVPVTEYLGCFSFLCLDLLQTIFNFPLGKCPLDLSIGVPPLAVTFVTEHPQAGRPGYVLTVVSRMYNEVSRDCVYLFVCPRYKRKTT